MKFCVFCFFFNGMLLGVKTKPKSGLYKDTADVWKNRRVLQTQWSKKKKKCFSSSIVSDEEKMCKMKCSGWKSSEE